MFLPFDGAHAILTPPVDITGAYTSGDVLFVPQEIVNAVQETKGASFLRAILLLDAANQKSAMDLLFFSQDPGSIGAANASLSVSTTQLSYLVGLVSVASGDWVTLNAAANAAAQKTPGDLLLPAIKSSKSLWVAGVARGTPTYATVADLTLKFALERH